MFDPFGDFETAGYLRNVEGLKDLEEVKVLEHAFFEANLEVALGFLKSRRTKLVYTDFLEVHRILFAEFYPWAGSDRHALQVGRLVGKGARVQFELAELCERAVAWGFQLGNDPGTMRERPGAVMGAFAWGHPFLDGNGRTMLLVHTELCHRAGMVIDWAASEKDRYLDALSQELAYPGAGHLDNYLRPLIRERQSRNDWVKALKSLPGLDGLSGPDENVAYRDDDLDAIERYDERKQSRGE